MLMLAARLGLLAVLGSAISNPYPLLSELWWGWEQECNPSWGFPDAAPVSCAEDFSGNLSDIMLVTSTPPIPVETTTSPCSPQSPIESTSPPTPTSTGPSITSPVPSEKTTSHRGSLRAANNGARATQKLTLDTVLAMIPVMLMLN
ncbi:hypothetical protein FOZ62_019869 [Perkinsus olseni]|uniref:Uncharacterized protein n=1 Tax=Perkinsus olseni TaxID=32597 RepID=A0A7J6UDP3_PEROL|nr:hypothetical protein FOZ62_019869 [Perkinsus olseni]